MLSCSSSQGNNQDQLNLSKMNTAFDVEHFFKKRLSNTRKIQQTDLKTLSKTELLKMMNTSMFATDTLYVYKNFSAHEDSLIASANSPLVKNTISNNIFGYDYYPISVYAKDTAAILANTYFSYLRMLQTKHKDFVALYAETESASAYNDMLLALNKKYSNEKSEKNADVHQWISGNAIIQLHRERVEEIDLLSEHTDTTKVKVKYYFVNMHYAGVLKNFSNTVWNKFHMLE